jgi:hypothetical protein
MPVPVLRPLSVGEILDAALKILVRNFLTLAKATGVVVLPAALIVAVIQGEVTTTPSAVINPQTGQIITNDASTLRGELFAVYLVTLIAALLASAICYKVVGDAYIGQRPDWRVALRFTAQRLLSIIWVALVLIIFFGLLVAAGVLVVALLAQVSTALGVVSGLALFVVVIWLALPAGLAVPTLMMEGRKGFKAYRRAFFLVRHNWWRTFALLLVTGILSGVVSLIADVIFGVALRDALGGTTAGKIFVDFILFGVTYLCIHPFEGSVLVILSIDIRVRKEGYDVALLASQLGVDASTVSLPYSRYATGGYPQPGVFPQPGGYPPPAGYPQPGGFPPPGGYPQPGYGVGPPSGSAPTTPGYPSYPAPGYPPPQPGYSLPQAGYSPPQPGYPPLPGTQPPAGSPPAPPGPGWWMASDGRWYPPESHPAAPPPAPPGPGWWMASDGRWYPPESHPSAPPPDPGTPPGPAPS